MPRNTLGDLQNRPVAPVFIRAWREHRRLSQEAVAERVGVTKATLSRIERGRQPYSQRILEAVAVVLECTPGDLITRDPVDPDGPWSLWEILDKSQRQQALRILRALADKAA